MLNIRQSLVLLAFFIFTNPLWAQYKSEGGSMGGNGGDDCENRIQLIASDISDWINMGGSKNLKLPNGLNIEKYNKEMLNILNLINSNEYITSAIECTSDKIIVSGTEKTCRWEKVEGDHSLPFKIYCNYDRFMNGVSDEDSKLKKEDAQYQIVHHEVAGAAGLEGNYQDRSRYNLSNQIVAFLENQVVRKLSINKPATTTEACTIFYQGNDEDLVKIFNEKNLIIVKDGNATLRFDMEVVINMHGSPPDTSHHSGGLRYWSTDATMAMELVLSSKESYLDAYGTISAQADIAGNINQEKMTQELYMMLKEQFILKIKKQKACGE